MDNLVISNLFYRKTRTLTTVAGVALGVVLVLLTVGIANGFLHEQGRRNSAVTAEIMFHPQGSFNLGMSTTLSIPVTQAEQLRAIPGVVEAVPVGNLLLEGRMVDGVDYGPFTRVSGLRVVEGRPIESGDEAIVDRVFQRSRNSKVGDEFRLLDRSFRIVGFYEPEALGRIKIPLPTLQGYVNREGLCSMILVKLDDPAKTEEVAARIKEVFPRNDVRLTRDLPILYARGTPALQTFLKVVVALSVIVSSLVILLAMYTTVTERTRQIGVLKSLGAAKGWIASQILKEAALISVLGVVAGFALSVAGRFIIMRLTTMNVELEPLWVFYSFLIGLASGVIGALYPALRAANQDPVKALSYE